ncbi:MAG: branched-chain amino acid ABC transporter permease [Oscillospiraceae bacterium]|jgi:branched-chain amino acid transport system permease protein|nr:branched-chain amino acid ABC transporter permease [Oscillospiraceae bacterium]
MSSLGNNGGPGARKTISFALPVLLTIVLAILPVSVNMGFTLVLFGNIMMYIVMSSSWAMFSGPTGYMSLAPAAFFGSGVYAVTLLIRVMPATLPWWATVPLLVVAGGLASLIVAVIIGSITLRLRGVYFTIFSFALVKLLDSVILFTVLRTAKTKGLHVLLKMTDAKMKQVPIGQDQLNNIIYYGVLILAFLTLLCAVILKRTKLGKSLTAIGESEEAAAHVGINTTLTKVSGFAISAFWAGAVGALWAFKKQYVDPNFAFDLFMSFVPVLMAVFGGMGYLAGPVVGAVVFTLIKEVVNEQAPSYSMLITGCVMVVAILFMPTGIVGLPRRFMTWLEDGGPIKLWRRIISRIKCIVNGIRRVISRIAKKENSKKEGGGEP